MPANHDPIPGKPVMPVIPSLPAVGLWFVGLSPLDRLKKAIRERQRLNASMSVAPGYLGLLGEIAKGKFCDSGTVHRRPR